MRTYAKMYNAGDRINETLNFSLPDGHDIHVVGKWHMDAPERSFFDVPTEMQVGFATIRVEFVRDILLKFGDRGLILVDKNREPGTILETEPVASNEDEAKRKGEANWKGYLRKVAQIYLDEGAQIRAAGGMPRAPHGFTKRALKLLNIADPTEEVFIKAGQQQTEVDALRQQLAELSAQLAALAAAQGPAAAGQVEKPPSRIDSGLRGEPEPAGKGSRK